MQLTVRCAVETKWIFIWLKAIRRIKRGVVAGIALQQQAEQPLALPEQQRGQEQPQKQQQLQEKQKLLEPQGKQKP
ncbi:hypothetical protein D3C87_1669240 [compost metagenome]